jgi:hypothetical protein
MYQDEPGTTEEGDVVEKLTALEAYRAGKLPLPPGYGLEYDADLILLGRDEGTLVAAFSARGTTPSEVARTAWDDHRQNEDLAVYPKPSRVQDSSRNSTFE